MNGPGSNAIASTRSCIECGISKEASSYYAKAAHRLDTVCKDCRKKIRNARYQSSKTIIVEDVQVNAHVTFQETTQPILELSNDEFRNLVDAFGILLQIDRRLKGEEESASVVGD